MIRLVLAGSAAALALTTMSASAQSVQMPGWAPVDGTLLDVSAEGSSTRVPDLAIIQAGVTTQAATASEAMAQNAARMARVLAALRKAGIAERDVQTARLSLSPQYKYEQNQPPVLTGYQAGNQVTVRFRDIGRTGGILDALVAQGATDISGPNLTLDSPDQAMDEARTDAVAKARARAELYAKASGLRVERILSISESGSPAMPMPMVSSFRVRAEAADTQVVAGETKLTVNLSVRFLLN